MKFVLCSCLTWAYLFRILQEKVSNKVSNFWKCSFKESSIKTLNLNWSFVKEDSSMYHLNKTLFLEQRVAIAICLKKF